MISAYVIRVCIIGYMTSPVHEENDRDRYHNGTNRSLCDEKT